MSNKFYNYISRKLINFFNNENVNYGDKFFIQFDEKNQVKNFYNLLKETANNYDNKNQNVIVEDFIYKHEHGTEYKTYSLLFKKNLKIVVAESSSIQIDYLVTLRNQVIDQTGVWEKTALLVICNKVIDSIYNGMRDLQTEDMPLNIKTIAKNLKDEVETSDLAKEEKEITKFYLTQKENEPFNTTLWDYEEILGIIEAKTITNKDLYNLGLFPDKNLKDFKPAGMRKRIEQNYQIHNEVTRINQYDDNRTELGKIFDKSGVEKLSKEDWCKTDYKSILESQQNFNKSQKTLNYIENSNKFTLDHGLIYWEKPLRETVAGRRKRHIIIFNEPGVETVKIDFEFDNTLYKKFLDQKYQQYATTNGRKLKVEFNIDPMETNFAKIVYKHNNTSKSTYEFNIAVVNCNEDFFESIKTRFTINNHNKHIVITNDDNSDQVSFGTGSNNEIIEIQNNDQNLILTPDDLITISENSPAWQNATLIFNIFYEGNKIPIEIKEDAIKAVPTKSLNLWKIKRENQENIIFNGVKALQGVNSYYIEDNFKEYLNYENQIIQNKIFYGKVNINGNIEKYDLKFSDELKNAYLEILDYYKKLDNIPSLVYLDNKLKNLFINFLKIYNNEIEEIQKDSILANQKTKINLNKIGTFEKGNKILYSSLSPLNIAYQLEIDNQCLTEKIDNNILERLTPENLVPFLFNENDELFRPIHQNIAQEWIIFEKSENVSIGTTNAFIANVVQEKMKQFISHFSYLFITKTKAPIKINIINIKEDKEIVKGVFNFIRERLSDKTNKGVIPVELNIYNGADKSSFDEFFDCNTPEQIKSQFDIKIKSTKIDPIDILRSVQNNITYYKHKKIPDEDYEYSHISFYKVSSDVKTANDNMKQINTGLSLNGLLSSVTSYNNHKEYRSGFGAANLLNTENLLVRTSINLNELIENNKNNGENTYSKGKTIITKPMELKKEDSEKLYKKSNWVTFIEPNFGLEYFDNSENLIIIHYSEQYTSTTKYDTITVTNKHEQYESIIKDFLKSKQIQIDDMDLDNVIKMFNSINGEWLLRVISHYSDYDREKLSIISAVKYCLTILDHPEITWIPISMEEILRIAGTVKLKKSEGILSSSKIKGFHSDDLLFLGIRENNGNINVYYYPIEVKEGINNTSTIDKGKKQINNTYNLIKEELGNVGEYSKFRNKFLRNFFMQIALSNELKLSTNHIWDEKGLDKIRQLKPRLLNDEYDISYELEKYIGKGSIVSFKKDYSQLFIDQSDNIQIIELSDSNAYQGIQSPLTKLYSDIHNNNTDIPSKDLFKNIELPLIISNNIEKETQPITTQPETTQPETTQPETTQPETTQPETTQPITTQPETTQPETTQPETTQPETTQPETTQPETTNNNLIPLENIRTLLGTVKDSNYKLYWEYGHSELSNRHLLILGRSGYGKTYFLQCLIKEMSKQKIPSLIIDYSDAFRKDELEKNFINELNNKIENHLVYINKFPLNPFRKHQIDLGGTLVDEKDIDIAGRFKSVINEVYDMGDQQLSTINQAVLNGLKKYGEDMNLQRLGEELENDDSSSSSTALNKLYELISNDPFITKGKFEWSELDVRSDKIIIIQLTGYSKDIQRIITELILWDLWYYKKQHGSKDIPFNVILDESQYLDFSNHSPSYFILKEGRKFGWSAWFSTQSIKGELSTSEINALNNVDEKIYFHPTSDSKNIANEFTNDTGTKKMWADKLDELKKKECVVFGSIKKNDGTLLPARPHKIKVDNLESRN